jgi:demethoxyubiquinone hydroxylase (CLK1/Coq7/Cat5 family)
LNSQLKTLNEQLDNLKKQKSLLEKSKKEELEKLNTSLKNLKITSYNTISDIIRYIDELY